MLVLTRKADEQILIGDNIKITLVRVRGNSVRIGIDAPREVRIVRGELDAIDPKSRSEIEIELDDIGQVFAHPQNDVSGSSKSSHKHRNRVGHLMDDISDIPPSATERSIFVGRIHRPDGTADSAHGPLSRYMAPR